MKQPRTVQRTCAARTAHVRETCVTKATPLHNYYFQRPVTNRASEKSSHE